MTEQGVRLSDRYRLESKVAAGGMAVVWKATDEVLERVVAAKILHPHLAMDETFRERFRVEALAAAALTHPNIVSVYDTGDHEDTPFIVMEYLGGGTLAEVLSRGVMDPAQTARIGAEVCRALEYAHSHGVIHRDIKPANILFSESGHLKVTDYGIAKAAFAGADMTTTGAVLGTIRYLAPEQVEGEEPDGRADLYSLGVILYEAVSARQPFVGDTDLAIAMARINSTPPRPRDIRAEVPRELDRVIMRALAPQRDQRYPDASSMGRDLEAMIESSEGEVDHGPPTEAIEVPQSFVRSEGRLIGTILLLLIVAGGLVFGFIQLRESGLLARLIPGNAGETETESGLEIEFTAGIYDPPPGDGSENNRDTSLVHDGDRATTWYTDCYSRTNMGGLKDGLGIFIELNEPVALQELEVVSVADGWSAGIRYSNDGDEWTRAASSETVSEREFTFQLDGEAHRYYQIWITQLARIEERCSGSEEGDWTVGISEIIPR